MTKDSSYETEEQIKGKIREKIVILEESLKELDDEILTKFELDQQIDQSQLIKELYSKRDDIKSNLKKTKAALENFKLVKKKRREKIELVLHDIKLCKNYVEIPGLIIGKNQVGNGEVYKMTKNTAFSWYHAKVRGGGLIADLVGMSPVICSSWAFIYSKYLTKMGVTSGIVDYCHIIQPTETTGRFVFVDKKEIKSSSDYAKLYLKKEGNLITISTEESEKCITLGFTATSESIPRFSRLYEALGITRLNITNMTVLESLVPYKWDLEILKS